MSIDLSVFRCRRCSRCRIAAGVLAACVGASVDASPSPQLELWVTDSGGRVGRVDVETGSVLHWVDTGSALYDIAFSPDGELYGLNSNTLFRIDPTTGARTTVGSLGVSQMVALVFGSDGTLYAARSNSTLLYGVSPTTGLATAIGDMGYAAAGDLAFNGSTLYMSTTTDQLVAIDAATGSGRLVGSLLVSNVLGLATAGNGVTYATAGRDIYSVDLASGALTQVSSYAGQSLSQAYGSAFYGEATPAPGAIALLVIGGLLPPRGRRRRG